MSILKTILYIFLIPVILFSHFFFSYISSISIIFVLSIILYRDLQLLRFWWLLPLLTIFVDITLYYWIGTNLFLIFLILLFLKILDRFVGNIILNYIGLFFSFFLFFFLFSVFIFIQESSSFNFFDLNLFLSSFILALVNFLVYSVFRIVVYFFNSYFNNEGF